MDFKLLWDFKEDLCKNFIFWNYKGKLKVYFGFGFWLYNVLYCELENLKWMFIFVKFNVKDILNI